MKSFLVSCLRCKTAMTLHDDGVCQSCREVGRAHDPFDHGHQAFLLYDSANGRPSERLARGFRMMDGVAA